MSKPNEALERKNEVLKQRIKSMILRENQDGLNHQDYFLKRQFIKEIHTNNYQLK